MGKCDCLVLGSCLKVLITENISLHFCLNSSIYWDLRHLVPGITKVKGIGMLFKNLKTYEPLEEGLLDSRDS